MKQVINDSIWSRRKLIVFRFVFAYLLIYNIPSLLDFAPFVSRFADYYAEIWQTIGVWTGKLIFRVDITVFTNGSGDTTYDYVLVFCYFCMAAVVAFVWTISDNKRTEHQRLFQILHVYVRYLLVFTMISYGAAKVIQSQFPGLTLDRLVQPYGDSSPMGLLWNFMGASPAYNIVTGLGEMIGGFLLAFRRTTRLGSLILAAVLANVVALNFSYDVPAKLYSTHLLAMTFFLLFSDLKQLINFFLLNKTVEPVTYQPLFAHPVVNRRMPVAVAVLIVLFAGWELYDSYQARQEYSDPASKSPLYGIWNVEEFEIEGEPQSLLLKENLWRRVIFDNPKMLAIQMTDDSLKRFALKTDTGKKALSLKSRADPDWEAALNYETDGTDQLIITGTFDEKSLQVKLKRTDTNEFLLTTRGFHWINESPFNR